MKRYLLFAGRRYYPVGGWGDFIDSFDTEEDAAEHVRAANKQAARDGKLRPFEWHEVVDTGVAPWVAVA